MDKKTIRDNPARNSSEPKPKPDVDQIPPMDNSRIILNLCTDMAQQIKEQVVDFVGHVTNN